MIVNHFERSSNYLSGSRCGDPALNGTCNQKSLSHGIRALICMLSIVLLCSPLMARAQELSATLNGIVTDTSGAVIPRIHYITLNGVNSTGRLMESDASGFYAATNSRWNYSVKVVAQGFETYNGKNIVLDVAENTPQHPAQSRVGHHHVTVEDNPVSVDTDSSAQAGTIDGVQVRELELSSRNFEQLVTLQPA